MTRATVGSTWQVADGEPGDHVVVLDAGDDDYGTRLYLHRVTGGWWFSASPDTLSDPLWLTEGHPWGSIRAPKTTTFTVVKVAE